MPYKKPKEIPFQAITELIRGKGITPPKLAVILECSPNTARSKMKNPSKFTLDDLTKIHHRGHLKKDALWNAILQNPEGL